MTVRYRSRRRPILPPPPPQPPPAPLPPTIVVQPATPEDKIKWTDIVAIGVSVVALCVAIVSAIVSWWQTGIAEAQANTAREQTEISKSTLDFAKNEAADSKIQSDKAMDINAKLANAATDQARELSKSVSIAAYSAKSSFLAADAASTQVKMAKVTPFQAALYAARLSAIQEYARASADLSTALHLAIIRVPDTLEHPHTLQAMTDQELMKAAIAARPMIEAWGKYIAASSYVMAPFSLTVNAATDKAESSGRIAYECFRWVGMYIPGDNMPDGWWDRIRTDAAKYCRGFKDPNRESAFDIDARKVLRVMTDELRAGDEQFVPGKPHKMFD